MFLEIKSNLLSVVELIVINLVAIFIILENMVKDTITMYIEWGVGIITIIYTGVKLVYFIKEKILKKNKEDKVKP